MTGPKTIPAKTIAAPYDNGMTDEQNTAAVALIDLLSAAGLEAALFFRRKGDTHVHVMSPLGPDEPFFKDTARVAAQIAVGGPGVTQHSVTYDDGRPDPAGEQ